MPVTVPSMTHNAEGNLIATGALGGGANTTADIDASNKISVQIQVRNTGGSVVSSTNGLRVEVFRRFGSGPTNDTDPVTSFTIPTIVSTTRYRSIELPTGRYRIRLTNLDATNSITVEATTSTIDSMVTT